MRHQWPPPISAFIYSLFTPSQEDREEESEDIVLERESKKKMATLGGIKEVEGNQNSLEIETLARYAVDEHNKKENALLEFVKVVNTKQQVVSGTVYYITLEAIDGGQKKVYETKVWVKPWQNFKEVQEFKLVGDVPSNSTTSA